VVLFIDKPRRINKLFKVSWEMWLLSGDVALSCNPSYWEARIVGCVEMDRPPHCKPMDFFSRTKDAPIVLGLQDSNRIL
jgi:hypothetical protein